MSTVEIWHVPLGRKLDLTREDLGVPSIPDLWDRLRSDKRPVADRGLQCLTCKEERPHAPEWMYLREHSDGAREAVHFNPSIGAHPAKTESDEHKAYKERIATIGETAGFQVAVEDAGIGRRTDVTVHGLGIDVGWEVQLSTITDATVRDRARTAWNAGLTPSWMTSAKQLSELLRHAPWSLTNFTPWREIRSGKAIQIRGGARQLRMEHCSRIPGPCPVKKRGKCDSWHGQWRVANPTLDDLVRGSASGEWVPVIVPQSRWNNRWWVRPEDRDTYAESVGGLPTEDDLRRGHAKAGHSVLSTAAMERICRYGEGGTFIPRRRVVHDQGQSVDASAVTVSHPVARPPKPTIVPPSPEITPGRCSAGVTPCGAPARLYPAGWRCEAHRPGAFRH